MPQRALRLGSSVSVGLGLLLGLSQVVANIRGGNASMANFRSEGVRRQTRILIACSFAVPIFVGATVGYWVFRDTPQAVGPRC